MIEALYHSATQKDLEQCHLYQQSTRDTNKDDIGLRWQLPQLHPNLLLHRFQKHR
jgi:hypothetical protein